VAERASAYAAREQTLGSHREAITSARNVIGRMHEDDGRAPTRPTHTRMHSGQDQKEGPNPSLGNREAIDSARHTVGGIPPGGAGVSPTQNRNRNRDQNSTYQSNTSRHGQGHSEEEYRGEGSSGEGYRGEEYRGEGSSGEKYREEGYRGEGSSGEGYRGEGSSVAGYCGEGHRGEGSSAEGYRGVSGDLLTALNGALAMQLRAAAAAGLLKRI